VVHIQMVLNCWGCNAKPPAGTAFLTCQRCREESLVLEDLPEVQELQWSEAVVWAWHCWGFLKSNEDLSGLTLPSWLTDDRELARVSVMVLARLPPNDSYYAHACKLRISVLRGSSLAAEQRELAQLLKTAEPAPSTEVERSVRTGSDGPGNCSGKKTRRPGKKLVKK
jgi:hypothetical protein